MLNQKTLTSCQWCEGPFRARRAGTAQRFCSSKCRSAFWTALRRWGESAVAAGVLSLDQIREGAPEACTPLPGRASSSSVAPCTRRLMVSFCCAGVNEGGRPMCFPWALARLRPSAVRVRIRSRSTSARPPSRAASQAVAAARAAAATARNSASDARGLGAAAERRRGEKPVAIWAARAQANADGCEQQGPRWPL